MGTHWLAPALEISLLIVLLATNPAHVVGRARWLRPLSITLIGSLMLVAIADMILGVTTSSAFSPTDVMPISAWAKLTMALRSLISLTVIGLVIARAVNAFA